MKPTWKIGMWIGLIMLVITAGAPMAFGQDGDTETIAKKSLLDFILAGRLVGFVILALSFAGVSMVVFNFMSITPKRLIPQNVIKEADRLVRLGKFTEIHTLCQASDSMISRVFTHGLAQGGLGIPAVQEAFQEQGVKEVTKLQHRIGYIGLIAAMAPMLGLLGTVTGMIASFDVLGTQGNTADASKLAEGISEALVTTCMGLIVAIPLTFFHGYFRNKVIRLGQEAAGISDRMVRMMTAIIEKNQTTKPGPAPIPAPGPGPVQSPPPAPGPQGLPNVR